MSNIKNPPSQEQIEKNNFPFYYCNIHYDIYRYKFARFYDKIADVLSKAFGVIVILRGVSTLLYSFYSKYSFEKYLFNRLIIVDEDDRKINIKNFEIKKHELRIVYGAMPGTKSKKQK